MSPTVFKAVAACRDAVPRAWLRPDGSVRRLALQEAFWRCVAYLVAEICGGAALPTSIQVGREGFPLRFDENAWRQLRRELELDAPEAQAAFRATLRSSLDRASNCLQPAPMTEPALGLLLLTLHLFHLNPSRREAFGTEFREFTVAARRHLRGGAPASIDERALRERLFELAGVSLAHPESVFEMSYRAYFLRLRDSLGAEWFAPKATAPEVLPRDLLTQALNKQGPAVEQRELEHDLRRRLDMLANENSALRGSDAREPLSTLLDPVLRLTGDPLVRLEAERAVDQQRLASEIAAACVQVLRQGELSLFGELGLSVRLTLPDPDYELEAAAPRERGRDGGGRYQITRRGLRLRGAVFLPARVIPDPFSHP